MNSNSGGVPPAVGPDTGKPDKPAELIGKKIEKIEDQRSFSKMIFVLVQKCAN